jgi:lipoprotein-anchoring transpeptidase ErfK/SrfK
MQPDTSHIHSIIQNGRDALRRGDIAEARGWAEQATRLAPELEEGWLLLTAVSAPRDSLKYAQRALEINPHSTRAHKAMEWARKRAGGEADSGGAAVQRSAKEAKQAAKPRGRLLPIVLLVGLVCAVIGYAAWSVSKSSALASIVRNAGNPAPTASLEPNFVMAEVAKPTYTPEWTATPSLTPTLTFTVTPSITPTLEFTSTPLPTDTPGVMEVAIVPDTPTPIRPTDAPYVAPTQQASNPPSNSGSSGGNGVRWIDINLSTQRLFAYEGDVIVNTFIVSTGVAATPTVTGTYKIYARFLYADMHGPGYYLPDVPYTMYFYKSYGIHGTYWHNNFGTPMSHGCVNMSIADAGWLYNWSTFGTTVKIHY